MTGPMASASPRNKARVAGLFYLLAVLSAIAGENFARDRVAIALGLIAVACFVVVTLLMYDVFKAANQRVALLATVFNMTAMSLETLRWNPRGLDIATVFHGFYCVLIGYLVFRSDLLPRTLGLLMAFSGLAWMVVLSPSLESHLSPYNVVVGFIGEGSLMLWLLVMGLHVRPRRHEASLAGGWQ